MSRPRPATKPMRDYAIAALTPVIQQAAYDNFAHVIKTHPECKVDAHDALQSYSKYIDEYTAVSLQHYINGDNTRNASDIKLAAQREIRGAFELHDPARHVIELALDLATQTIGTAVVKAKMAMADQIEKRAAASAAHR